MHVNDGFNRLINFMGLHPHVAEVDLRNIVVVGAPFETVILLALLTSSNQIIVNFGKDSESMCLEVGFRE